MTYWLVVLLDKFKNSETVCLEQLLHVTCEYSCPFSLLIVLTLVKLYLEQD